MIICSFCGCDIDAMGQDNMSCNLDENLCEDCWRAKHGKEERT